MKYEAMDDNVFRGVKHWIGVKSTTDRRVKDYMLNSNVTLFSSSVQAGDPQEISAVEKHQVQGPCIWEESVDKRKRKTAHIQAQECEFKVYFISKMTGCAITVSFLQAPFVCSFSLSSQSKHQNL